MGLVTPWIFDPNQSNRVGQKTSIIRGVPEPAKYRKEAESTARMEASKATLVLNQRFSRRISNTPKQTPMIMLGSFTE